MEDKINWMLEELRADGFDDISAEIIRSILEDQYMGDDGALTDYISELNNEYPD